jgi:hypothetical protein
MSEEIEEIHLKNLTTIVTRGGIQIGCCGSSGLSDCGAMNRLGKLFLETEYPKIRSAIEKFFIGYLTPESDASRPLKYVALSCFTTGEHLLSNDALTTVQNFRTIPANKEVVEMVAEFITKKT